MEGNPHLIHGLSISKALPKVIMREAEAWGTGEQELVTKTVQVCCPWLSIPTYVAADSQDPFLLSMFILLTYRRNVHILISETLPLLPSLPDLPVVFPMQILTACAWADLVTDGAPWRTGPASGSSDTCLAPSSLLSAS